MPAKNLEANVRHLPRVAIVDLHGEINAFASEHYRNIFEITRLSDAIHIYNTEAEALAAARTL
jgi:hypothetical protein